MDAETDINPVFVMILPSCRGRSVGDNAIRRAEAIAPHFHVVIISDSFPDRVPDAVETIKLEPRRFDYLHRFCHVPNEIGFAHAARKAVLEICRSRDVKFVLCHGYTLAWYAGRWIRHKTGVPFGMFMHGHIFERPKGTYDPRVTAFYKTVARTCYRESDLVFALSPDQARLAIAAGAPSSKVVVAPNGLNLSDIGLSVSAVEAKLKSPPRPPWKILYVGRFVTEKGIPVLLEACESLRHDGIPFSLTLIGSGPVESEVQHFIDSSELRNLVKLLGALSRPELGQHYLESDILCVPSLSEPLGNVVLEGMASGCAVVASDTGGIPSMLEHDVNGVLAPPGDSSALYSAISRLMENQSNIAALRVAGFETLQRKFSWLLVSQAIVDAVSHISRLRIQGHV